MLEVAGRRSRARRQPRTPELAQPRLGELADLVGAREAEHEVVDAV
jgi:hypothetical protein